MKVMIQNLLSFILPITAAVIIPYFTLEDFILPIAKNPTQVTSIKFVLGLIILFVGLFLLVSTIRTFILIGKGTLAPWSPTSRLIVGGIYSYVRNPMITGVLFILVGETLIFNSIGLLIWLVSFFTINHIYFIFSEEPGLFKRFGNEYQIYKRNVPRWIPRLKPWKPDRHQ